MWNIYTVHTWLGTDCMEIDVFYPHSSTGQFCFSLMQPIKNHILIPWTLLSLNTLVPWCGDELVFCCVSVLVCVCSPRLTGRASCWEAGARVGSDHMFKGCIRENPLWAEPCAGSMLACWWARLRCCQRRRDNGQSKQNHSRGTDGSGGTNEIHTKHTNTLTHIHTHTQAHYWWRSGIILKGERSDARSLSRKLNPRSQLTPRLQLLRLLRILKDSLHKQHKPTLQFITATALIFSILNENLILNSLKTFRITRQWSSGELRKIPFCFPMLVSGTCRDLPDQSPSPSILPQFSTSPHLVWQSVLMGISCFFSPLISTLCFCGFFAWSFPAITAQALQMELRHDHSLSSAWRCLAHPGGVGTVHNRIPLISPKVGLVWGCWKLGWKLQSHVSLLL